jgi:hypothetical protein
VTLRGQHQRHTPAARHELDRAARAEPLSYALAAARIGWWTFPLAAGQKTPEGSLVPHGVKDASRDEAQLRAWWASRPELGIGLACGPSGLLVLDVDPRNGGDVVLEEFVRAHGALPHTPTAETGGGGAHFVFRAPVDPVTGEVLRLRAKLAPGLDLKGDGGYIVVAPSVHPSGQRYRWHPRARPSETPLADLPGWALEMARHVAAAATIPPHLPRENASSVDRASRYLARLDPSISGSGGHDALWRAALAMVRGFCLSEADALALLAGEFNPRCQPAWSLAALRHKVEGAARDARSEYGWLLDRERPRR